MEVDSPQIRALMKQLYQKLPVKVTVEAAAAALAEELAAILGGELPSTTLARRLC